MEAIKELQRLEKLETPKQAMSIFLEQDCLHKLVENRVANAPVPHATHITGNVSLVATSKWLGTDTSRQDVSWKTVIFPPETAMADHHQSTATYSASNPKGLNSNLP